MAHGTKDWKFQKIMRVGVSKLACARNKQLELRALKIVIFATDCSVTTADRQTDKQKTDSRL